MRRIQENILAKRERRLLNWLCAKLPPSITPDRLTLFGFLGAVMVLAGGALSTWHAGFLWLAGFGLFVNWAGDSLDGSLARFRDIARPRYGYFLDHSVDALNNSLIMTGIGLTGSIRLGIALLSLTGYLLLCIYVFLRRQVLQELKLSFLFIGPTELRLVLLGITMGIFFYPNVGLIIAGQTLTIYEMLLLFSAIVFLLIFIWFLLETARHLRTEDQV